MIELLKFAGWVYLSLEIFYMLFIAAMGLYRAHLNNQLTTFAKIVGTPVIIAAIMVDYAMNWTIALVMFWELPQSKWELVTTRMTRYIDDQHPDGRRKSIAKYVCSNLLDFMDPRGRHCIPPATVLKIG